MDSVTMKGVLTALANIRPIFHSEDDFKVALAWQIKHMHPAVEIRLEYPVRSRQGNRRFDILVIEGGSRIPIELKYKTQELTHTSNTGEVFELISQSADNHARYDFCKDISRIETFPFTSAETKRGFAIFLTNAPRYWKGTTRTGNNDKEFEIKDGITLSGTRAWRNPDAATAKNGGRQDPIAFIGTHRLQWENFSTLPSGTPTESHTFRFLLVSV